MNNTFAATTREVQISVQSFFLEERSSPEEGQFVWAYRVRIENHSPETVQLLHRKWEITDTRGHTIRVEGPGVVGEQPVMEPGEGFEYTSGTPLSTSSGFMVGTYRMLLLGSGEVFDAAIPAFSLDSPYEDDNRHVH